MFQRCWFWNGASVNAGGPVNLTLFTWQIEFARPIWFAVLAAGPLWIVFWRRSLLQMSPARRFLSVLMRILLLTAVAVGLARPEATVDWQFRTSFRLSWTSASHDSRCGCAAYRSRTTFVPESRLRSTYSYAIGFIGHGKRERGARFAAIAAREDDSCRRREPQEHTFDCRKACASSIQWFCLAIRWMVCCASRRIGTGKPFRMAWLMSRLGITCLLPRPRVRFTSIRRHGYCWLKASRQ